MGFKDWAAKKLEERRERKAREEEEKKRIRDENLKYTHKIEELLEKFTIKELQMFCTKYIGVVPKDESFAAEYEDEHDEEEDEDEEEDDDED